MTKRGHGEGTVEWDEKRHCYFVRVTYKDPVTGQSKRKKLKGTNKITETLRIGQRWLEEFEQRGRQNDADHLTLGQWIEQWVSEYVKGRVRVKSFDKYEGCLRLYVQPYLGDMPIRKVSALDVQRLLNRLRTEGGKSGVGISTSTIKATRRYLSMCMDQAVRLRLIMHNVVKDCDAPKVLRKEICPLTATQSEQLISEAKRSGNSVGYMAILLTLNTGMRLGEVFGLKWQDIDWELGTIHIQRSLVTASRVGQLFQEPKTAKSRRRIPLPVHVLKELKVYRDWQENLKNTLQNKWHHENMVFANWVGKPVDTSNFTSRFFKAMLENAGIDRSFKFHDLRHTHATLLLRERVNAKVIQERLGHSTITMTLDTYSHLLPDMQSQAVEALERLYGNHKDY